MNLITAQYLYKLTGANAPLAKWGKLNAVNPSNLVAGDFIWRCVHVHKLTDAENEGGHNVYIDLLDAYGNRLDIMGGVGVAWAWDGMTQSEQPPNARPEKKAPEPLINFALFRGMIAYCRVADRFGSDIVRGLDAEYGHTSYYVVFQYQQIGSELSPRPDGGTVAVSVETLRRAQQSAKALYDSLMALG